MKLNPAIRQVLIGFVVIAAVSPLWTVVHEMGHAYLYRKLGCWSVWWTLWPASCSALCTRDMVQGVQAAQARYEWIDLCFWLPFVSALGMASLWRVVNALLGPDTQKTYIGGIYRVYARRQSRWI